MEPPAGASPAYASGWVDAVAGEECSPGASPAYWSGFHDAEEARAGEL